MPGRNKPSSRMSTQNPTDIVLAEPSVLAASHLLDWHARVKTELRAGYPQRSMAIQSINPANGELLRTLSAAERDAGALQQRSRLRACRISQLSRGIPLEHQDPLDEKAREVSSRSEREELAANAHPSESRQDASRPLAQEILQNAPSPCRYYADNAAQRSSRRSRPQTEGKQQLRALGSAGRSSSP